MVQNDEKQFKKLRVKMSSAESFVVPNWRKYRKETDDFNCQKYPKSAKMAKMTKMAKFVAISRRPKIYDVHMDIKLVSLSIV